MLSGNFAIVFCTHTCLE